MWKAFIGTLSFLDIESVWGNSADGPNGRIIPLHFHDMTDQSNRMIKFWLANNFFPPSSTWVLKVWMMWYIQLFVWYAGCWLLDVLMEYLITLEAKSCSKSHAIQFQHIIHQWHSSSMICLQPSSVSTFRNKENLSGCWDWRIFISYLLKGSHCMVKILKQKLINPLGQTFIEY